MLHWDFPGSQDSFTVSRFTVLPKALFSPMAVSAHTSDGKGGEIVRKDGTCKPASVIITPNVEVLVLLDQVLPAVTGSQIEDYIKSTRSPTTQPHPQFLIHDVLGKGGLDNLAF